MTFEDESPMVEHRSLFDTIPAPPPFEALAEQATGRHAQRVASTVPETGALHFPAGTVVKACPTKAQLQESAVAWLTMAQNQMGSVRYWAEQGDRTHETLKSLDVLASQLAHVRRALQESELAR